jgi:hypothetical protein
MDDYFDVIERRKNDISKGIDVAMENGEASEGVLLEMKDMLSKLKPVTSMEEYTDLELD